MSSDDAVLTVAQARAVLEGQTQQHFGMSLDAFLDAAEQGELPDRPMVRHLLMLAGASPRPLRLLRSPVGEAVETEPERIRCRPFEGEVEVL